MKPEFARYWLGLAFAIPSAVAQDYSPQSRSAAAVNLVYRPANDLRGPPSSERAPATTTPAVYTKLPMTTGRVLTRFELAAACDGEAVCGDDLYAQVRDDWLRTFYQEFRRELFRRGIVRSDARFDCNHFSAFFTSLAGMKYFAENFHTRAPAGTLAIGEVWYRPGAGSTSHAIVVAITERGRIFLDPQTGNFLTLTPEEWATRFLVKF